MSPERGRWFGLRKMDTIPELEENVVEVDDDEEDNSNFNCNEGESDDAIINDDDVSKVRRPGLVRRVLRRVVKFRWRNIFSSCLGKNREVETDVDETSK